MAVNATRRPLYTRERDPVLVVQEVEWAPGPVWRGAENLACSEIGSPDHPARRESLYRLRFLAHQINCVPSINQHRIPLRFVNELRQRNREIGRFATPPERQVSLTRISWNLNSELLTAYSTLTFTCTAIIDTSPRALCGSIKIRTIVQLNSWAQPLSSLSSMSPFPVAQYQDNPLHFLGR